MISFINFNVVYVRRFVSVKLNEITFPVGRKRRKTKRLGRGDASGQGGTSGRGHKGQKSRAGGYHKIGFEGGQMPLIRRLPKRGFTNIFKKEYAIVNLEQLANFPVDSEVNAELLIEHGVIKNKYDGLAVLGRGDVPHALIVKAARFSASAKQKIEAKGGKTEVVSGR